MRWLQHGVIVLGLATLASTAHAEPPAPIEVNVAIAAPRAAVWSQLASEQGMERWFGPDCSIEPRVDGLMNVWFAPANPPGTRGAENMRVLAFEPEQRLAFTWDAPPNLPYARGQRSMVEIVLADAPGGGTAVTLRHFGFGETHEQWALTREYFSGAWVVVMARFRYSLEHGALDWNNLPPELGYRAASLDAR